MPAGPGPENPSPGESVSNSEFQWDRVEELKQEICLSGTEDRFKRKKN